MERNNHRHGCEGCGGAMDSDTVATYQARLADEPASVVTLRYCRPCAALAARDEGLTDLRPHPVDDPLGHDLLRDQLDRYLAELEAAEAADHEAFRLATVHGWTSTGEG